MTTLTTTCGKKFLVDEASVPVVEKTTWRVNTHGYIQTTAEIPGKKGQYTLLHRLLMGAKKGEIVDHIDGDKMNNTFENLRFASNTQNTQNQKKTRGKSIHKGVVKSTTCDRWLAQIGGKKTRRYLGSFPTEDEAAHAYNKAAVALYGDFACINPIGQDKGGSHD